MMLERPDEGTVRFDGVDPFSLKGAELLKFRRRVQMVFQDPYASLNSRMSRPRSSPSRGAATRVW